MNIYQIKTELLDIFDQIEENEGELTPELEEQLTITQEDFKEKIESYTNVIKHLNDDITSIKAEQKRLKDLSDRKEKTIERLKTIIIEAVEEFGDTKKSGVKFFDYGTGQVSIRNSKAVNVDDDVLKKICNSICSIVINDKITNQLDVNNNIDIDSLITVISSSAKDEDGNILNAGYTINENDLNHTNLELSVKVPVSELINGKSYPIIREIAKNTDVFKAVASVSKTDIKKELEENGACAPNIARLIINKNISIK